MALQFIQRFYRANAAGHHRLPPLCDCLLEIKHVSPVLSSYESLDLLWGPEPSCFRTDAQTPAFLVIHHETQAAAGKNRDEKDGPECDRWNLGIGSLLKMR